MKESFLAPRLNIFYKAIMLLFTAGSFTAGLFRRNNGAVSSIPKKILVVRLDHIGDLFMTMPFFASIKRTYPDAKITLLANKNNIGLIEGNSYIDEYLDYDPFWLSKAWFADRSPFSRFFMFMRGLRGYIGISRKVRSMGFDVVFEPRGDFFSAILAVFSRANKKVGFSEIGKELFDVSVPYPKNEHWMEAPLALIRAVGGRTAEVRYELHTSKGDADLAEKIYEQYGLSAGGKIIGIHPCVNDQRREWDDRKFAELSDRLMEDYKAKVLFFGAGFDVPKIQNIISMMEHKPIDLSGKTSIKQMAEVIRRCDLFIGLESSGMHIAAAVDTPYLIIYGGYTDPGQFGPYKAEGRIVRKEVECRYCFGRGKCAKECLSNIAVSDVLSEAAELLKK
jgi:ADP-heptose:LPS heptosyltransferase